MKIDETTIKMGGKIDSKSRESVPGSTPKWRQEVKIKKEGWWLTRSPSRERFLRKMASKTEAKIKKKSIKSDSKSYYFVLFFKTSFRKDF